MCFIGADIIYVDHKTKQYYLDCCIVSGEDVFSKNIKFTLRLPSRSASPTFGSQPWTPTWLKYSNIKNDNNIDPLLNIIWQCDHIGHMHVDPFVSNTILHFKHIGVHIDTSVNNTWQFENVGYANGPICEQYTTFCTYSC